jgi:hypothetical protein
LSSTLETSPLVRLLSQWTPAREPASPPELAEGLARWVSAFDAIGLQAAHRGIRAMDPGAAGTPVDAAALARDIAQVRAALAQAIEQDAALPNETSYTPYKRRHLELQRQMDQAIGALRERARRALSRGAPRLRQLAALDAALETVLSRREQAILPTAVALLERRFQEHRKAQPKEREDAPDDFMAWRRPGGWLHAFEAEWRRVLMAELALRLEPVAGLVEAGGIALNDD